MTEAIANPEASAAPPLNQVQRVVDTFVDPGKTFNDIQRSSSWWLPWLIGVIVTILFGFTVQQKIGWDRTYENILRQSPSQMQRIEGLPADQQARAKSMGANITRYIFWSTPLTALIVAVISAAVLLATINFGFGGRAKFGQMLAVWMYGTLPWAIQGILMIITIYAGVDPDSFNLRNPVGTNIGYYLPTDLPKWLIALGTSIDIFTIWALVLLTIGCAMIGRVKRSSAATAVWGWWILITLARVIAASFS